MQTLGYCSLHADAEHEDPAKYAKQCEAERSSRVASTHVIEEEPASYRRYPRDVNALRVCSAEHGMATRGASAIPPHPLITPEFSKAPAPGETR